LTSDTFVIDSCHQVTANMTLNVAQPTKDQIAQDPRAFALFKQATHQSSGLNQDELLALAKKYGNAKAAEEVATSSGEVSWDKIVAAFKAPATPDFEGVEQVQDHKQGSRALGMAASDEQGKLAPHVFTRRTPGPNDIHIQVAHCGICHSDLHQVLNEWKNTKFPCVPGHEITGIVTEVGANVKNFKVGDRAGVGCMVDSCRDCPQCKADAEQFCDGPCTFTYNSPEPGTDATTKGGYSSHLVVNADFALHVPDNISLAGAAPLLCAGITVYSPLRHYGLDKPGMKLGVIGLGGLGHMAVKIGKAMGLEVTVLSTSEKKREEATSRLGADHFVVSKDKEQMGKIANSLDGIIDTVSANHPLPDYLALLKLDGKLVTVGVPPEPLQLPTSALIFGRKLVGGSLIGGIKETQEMLDFCGKHNITSDIEEIPASYLNEAMQRMLKSDVHYRFVIDVQGSMIG
jgi:cinnamyl-alcohol dehydrogenase